MLHYVFWFVFFFNRTKDFKIIKRKHQLYSSAHESEIVYSTNKCLKADHTITVLSRIPYSANFSKNHISSLSYLLAVHEFS